MKTILIGLLFSASLSLTARAVVFPFSEITLDENGIFEMGKKSVNALVKDFRKEGIEIVIVPRPGQDRVANADLTPETLRSDAAAVAYYDKHVFEPYPVRGGGFLEPFHFIWSLEAKKRRPFHNTSLMILRNSVVPTTLIHEYLHYAVYQQKKPATVEVNGKTVSAQSADREAERDKRKRVAETQDKLDPDGKDLGAEKEFCEATYDHIPLLLRKLVEAQGGEIEVIAFLLKHREKFPYLPADLQSETTSLRLYIQSLNSEIQMVGAELTNLKRCYEKAKDRKEEKAVEKYNADRPKWVTEGQRINKLLNEYYQFYETLPE